MATQRGDNIIFQLCNPPSAPTSIIRSGTNLYRSFAFVISSRLTNTIPYTLHSPEYSNWLRCNVLKHARVDFNMDAIKLRKSFSQSRTLTLYANIAPKLGKNGYCNPQFYTWPYSPPLHQMSFVCGNLADVIQSVRKLSALFLSSCSYYIQSLTKVSVHPIRITYFIYLTNIKFRIAHYNLRQQKL